jgi:sugar lactone lactonase YvrE
VDAAGNVYVADAGNATIRKIDPTGAVTTLAGLAGVAGTGDNSYGFVLFNQPHALTIDGAGNLFVADTGNGLIRKITAAGVVTTLTLTPTTSNPPPSGGTNGTPSSGGDGGGAPSWWFSGTLLLLAAARRATRLIARR